MKITNKVLFFIPVLIFACFAGKSIKNVQFTDMNGKTYDLYNLLTEKKRYVYVEMIFNQ